MKPTTIVLADDHAIVRAGIRLMLEKIAGVEVVAEAKDGREALGMVRKHQPDILVTDIAMPFLNGIEAAGRIAREFSHVRILILSMYATEEHVQQAMKAGIAGYLLKESAPAELEIAIRALSEGKTYLSPPVSQKIVRDYRGQLNRKEDTVDLLTSRQREILQMLAEGHTAKEIAQTLNISYKTVENHRTEIMERLQIHDLPGLVRFAVRHGIVSLEQ